MLFLLFAAILFPVAAYCLALGLINRRRTPLLVPGAWDFAGVLFASAGFLLLGGPYILITLSGRLGLNLIRQGGWLFEISWLIGVAGLLLYAGVVGGVAVWTLRARQKLTVVYNVEPAVFEEVLGQLLNGLGYSWRRSGNQLLIGPGGSARLAAPDPLGQTIQAVPDKPSAAAPRAATVLQVDDSPSLYNVVLTWHQTDPPTRHELERGLGKVLAGVPTLTNSVGGWFLMAGSVLSCLTFLLLIMALRATAAAM